MSLLLAIGQLDFCYSYAIADSYTFVFISLYLYFGLKHRHYQEENRHFHPSNIIMLVFNIIALILEIGALPLFNRDADVGDCWIIYHTPSRYMLFLTFLAIWVGLPYWQFVYRKK